MRTDTTCLDGVLILTPKVYSDDRGMFEETYQAARHLAIGIDCRFVQDNHSRSSRHVLRGMHYQVRKPQAKLVTVIRGSVLDIVVDLRPGSATFGMSAALEMSDENHRQIFVPAGLAHGFLVLSEVADVCYKCSDFYDPADEAGVAWNDPTLALPWPAIRPVLSPKDAALPQLNAIPRERMPWEGRRG